MRAPTRDNRCTVVVPSAVEYPRTWRCWHPLPCPNHGGREVVRGVTIRNETVALPPQIRLVPVLRPCPACGFGGRGL